jgi:large subunit ribosomal protein L6
MAKEVARQVEIPEGVEVEFKDSVLTVKGPLGQASRKLWFPGIEITRDEAHLIVNSNVDRKRQRAMTGTLAAHIANMVEGVTKGFEYRMKIVYSHFPIQLKTTTDEVVISNFLGERKARSAKIVGGTKVEVAKDEVVVKGINKENVGQTMANIEQATRVKGFDVRVFQDGIYLVEKR